MPTPEQAEQKPATPPVPEVQQVPETPEISPEAKRAGVQPVATQFTASTVQTDTAQPSTSDNTSGITIEPPDDETILTELSKGPKNESKTWLGAFWIRIIKKAKHFGWRIIGRGDQVLQQ